MSINDIILFTLIKAKVPMISIIGTFLVGEMQVNFKALRLPNSQLGL